MFTFSKLNSVDYYLKGGEGYIYYSNCDADRWWVASSSDTQTIFGVSGGDAILEGDFRSLAAGKLADGREIAAPSGIRVPGFDLQFAAPKSVSVCALVGDGRLQTEIIEAHDTSVRVALDFVFRSGFMESRRGRGGEQREAAANYCAALFRHLTSRENDPQLHTHCVIPNVALRADGSVGALEPRTLLKFQRLVGAIYRAELASRIAALKMPVERRGRAFELGNMPSAIVDLFSKRRQQIEAVAETFGFNTAGNRQAAQSAALSTRRVKAPIGDIATLRQAWVAELTTAGLHDQFASALAPTPPDRQPPDLADLRNIVDASFKNEAVLTWPYLAASVAEQLQCTMTGTQIEQALEEIQSSLVLFLDDAATPLASRKVSTRRILDTERSMVRSALLGQDLKAFVPRALVDKIVSSHPTLSLEQVDAVKHALNNDAVAIFEGAAGAGKSFALGVVAEICRQNGLEVFTTAPSWSATNVIAADTRTPEEKRRALAGLILRLQSEEVVLTQRSVVILDEGGMVGLDDMATLVWFVRQAGAKLIVAGDTMQLQPVAAGAPMRMLARALGSSRIGEIRRQKMIWNRRASMDFAAGRLTDALSAYDHHGHVEWSLDRDNALEAAADRYVADMIWDTAQVSELEKSSLVMSSRNQDVVELNRKIRLRLRAAGYLSSDESTVSIAVRKDNVKTTGTIQLAVGDRIAFNETIELPGRTIRNADVATLLRNDSGVLELRFERDGQIVRAPLADLVGFRTPDEPKLPLLRHAYAVTVHFAQGMTVDRAYVAAVSPMNREAMYVAMTRHREVAQLFVDGSRFAEDKALTSIAKERFYSECGRPAAKWNASDFIEDLEWWSEGAGGHLSEGPFAKALVDERNPRELAASSIVRNAKNYSKLGVWHHAHSPSGIPNGAYRKLQVERFSLFGGGRSYAFLVQWVDWLKSRVDEISKALVKASLGVRRPLPKKENMPAVAEDFSAPDAEPSAKAERAAVAAPVYDDDFSP